MELALLIRFLRRRWWIIAIPALLSLLLTLPDFLGSAPATSGGFSTQLRYSAAQKFNLPQRDGDYQDVWLASELTVNAFTDWVRSRSFRQEIAAQLSETDISLAPLGIAADNARSVGVIYLSHPESAALQAIAEAVIAVLSERSQIYFPQLGGESAQVTLLDPPQAAAAAPPLTNRFAPFIRIAAGLFIGLVLALSAEYLDRRIYDPQEIQQLGLPLIGCIPKHSD